MLGLESLIGEKKHIFHLIKYIPSHMVTLTCNMKDTTGRAGYTYPSGAPDVPPDIFGEIISLVLYFLLCYMQSILFGSLHCVCRSALFPVFAFWSCIWIFKHFGYFILFFCRYKWCVELFRSVYILKNYKNQNVFSDILHCSSSFDESKRKETIKVSCVFLIFSFLIFKYSDNQRNFVGLRQKCKSWRHGLASSCASIQTTTFRVEASN